jgi:uncharacterized membrane protein YhhN
MVWEELMDIWLILAIIFAVLEAIAVAKDKQRLEYIAKPAVMVCLFLWVYTNTDLQGNAFWYGLGILFSLVGDVLLMFSSDRLLLWGLVAFLFAHFMYITGFWDALAFTNVWSVVLLVIIAINVNRLIRRITSAMRAKGQDSLVIPVVIYGTVISIMLFVAMSTIYDPAWTTPAAFLVSAGALLFVTSDAILAWNKFVAPMKNGRVWNIVLYYLGQLGIIAGAISQFG